MTIRGKQTVIIAEVHRLCIWVKDIFFLLLFNITNPFLRRQPRTKFMSRISLRTLRIGSQLITLNLTDYTQRKIYFRAFEQREKRFVTAVIKSNMTVVDVGANVGFFSCIAASKMKIGKIIAFEPVHETFKSLESNIDFKFFDAFNLAVSDVSGVARMVNDHDSKDLSNGFYRVLEKNDDMTESIEVDVCRLDEMLQQLGIDRVHLLKIDVEGHELRVLNGCGDFLRPQTVGYILFEVFLSPTGLDESSEAVISKLVNHGFKLHRISRTGSLKQIESVSLLRTRRRSALNLVAVGD